MRIVTPTEEAARVGDCTRVIDACTHFHDSEVGLREIIVCIAAWDAQQFAVGRR